MTQYIDLENNLKKVHTLLERQEYAAAAAMIGQLHPADGADILTRLEADEQAQVVARLEGEILAAIFGQMDEEEMSEVARQMAPDAVVELLGQMAPDMAADLLGELADEQTAAYLEQMADSTQVAPLLAYDEQSAGGLMNPLKPMLRRHMTVAEAIDFLRAHYQDERDLYYLYVLDRDGRLVGVTGMRSIILARPEQTLEELMDPDVIAVRADTDQEKVVQLLSHYDFLALPVVDHDHKLLGVVTFDDVLDAAEEEATEDFQRIGGMEPMTVDYARAGVGLLWRKRIGWLLLLLLADFLSSSVIAHFEDALTAVVALAFFIPMLIDSGGNTGTQAATLIVRGLATGDLHTRDWLAVVWKELRVGLLLGVTLGTIVYVRGFFWRGGPEVGLVVGLTMVVLVLWANIIGSVLPVILTRLKLDPAVISSPFITTAADVTGLVIYFNIARWVLEV